MVGHKEIARALRDAGNGPGGANEGRPEAGNWRLGAAVRADDGHQIYGWTGERHGGELQPKGQESAGEARAKV